ncbi:hypothetical protein [Qingshengfaniella alkalisoli]|uniref:FlgN protein n=1 Tax=Qingshengfaniella alkalisoli TaxID=2599296 RepID=A0A5B8IWU8_9RHOB|nr:hypothetical protein [Qingshengfaniella alkalisoli]QDY70164.1 hypothetical protein FPZ52_11375 [Qingshengfaniella alkalisoli]
MNAHDKLEALLDKERQKLITSDLNGLQQIAEQKVALIDRIKRVSLDQSELSALARKLKRNQALMQACSEGIGTAKQRLSDLLQNRAATTTYTGNGQRTTHQTPQSIEKRA